MKSPQRSLLALADKNRLMLFRLLLARAFSVGELTQVTGLGQSLVSHHLAVLSRHGWIQGRRQGRRRLYRSAVSGSPLAPLARWIERQVPLPSQWRASLQLADDLCPKPSVGQGDLEDYLL